MFRDASEELKRLQAELLAEDEPEELPPEEPPEEEEFLEEYEDTRPADGPAVYQNYSNNYGKDLRNYASGYRAYNTDRCDEDLEEFSEEVLESNTSGGGCVLALIAIILAMGIIGVLVYGYLFTRGYIG